MKVVILAGGFGTRLSEETEVKPKPMVEIGGYPMLWHIMKHYMYYDFNDFFVALGYKGEVIKRYFLDYHDLSSHMKIDLMTGSVMKGSKQKNKKTENWNVHLVDTGDDVNTGARIKRLKPWLKEETFMVTYGDGVSNIDYRQLILFHKRHGKMATITAVRPPARFGGLIFKGNKVVEFTEKPQVGEGWINGGFMVLEPAIFDLLHGKQCSLESDALRKLAAAGQLCAYRHEGFWQCMDTLRDKRLLEGLWQGGCAPWKVWQ